MKMMLKLLQIIGTSGKRYEARHSRDRSRKRVQSKSMRLIGAVRVIYLPRISLARFINST